MRHYSFGVIGVETLTVIGHESKNSVRHTVNFVREKLINVVRFSRRVYTVLLLIGKDVDGVSQELGKLSTESPRILERVHTLLFY